MPHLHFGYSRVENLLLSQCKTSPRNRDRLKFHGCTWPQALLRLSSSESPHLCKGQPRSVVPRGDPSVCGLQIGRLPWFHSAAHVAHAGTSRLQEMRRYHPSILLHAAEFSEFGFISTDVELCNYVYFMDEFARQGKMIPRRDPRFAI